MIGVRPHEDGNADSGGRDSESGDESDSESGASGGSDGGSAGEGCGYKADRVTMDASHVAVELLSVPWLEEPSPLLTHAIFVHRGPLSGGHLKLFLRAEGGGARG